MDQKMLDKICDKFEQDCKQWKKEGILEKKLKELGFDIVESPKKSPENSDVQSPLDSKT